MLEAITLGLDWLGVVAFALTGALVASRKEMDLVGFAFLAIITGIGGGTLRDVLLGSFPVFWVREPAYVVVCTAVAILAFPLVHTTQTLHRPVLWFDALGLALFAVTGAEKAIVSGAGAEVACVMGVVTATFGGIIRDVLGGESPTILRKEIYATAALLGALTFLSLQSLGMPRDAALVTGFAVGLFLRGAGLFWNWSLPRSRPRRGESTRG
jgi:uncharacterized membrane protein YeiH